jgi:hypothetical protein
MAATLVGRRASNAATSISSGWMMLRGSAGGCHLRAAARADAALTAFSLNAALALHQTDIFASRTPTSGICRQSGTTTGYLFYLGNRRSMALRSFVQIMPVPTMKYQTAAMTAATMSNKTMIALTILDRLLLKGLTL